MQRRAVHVGYAVRRSWLTGPTTDVTVYNSHPTESVAEAAICRLVETILSSEGVENGSVSIILCDRARHGELHRRYLRKEEPTDVLAFSLGEDDEFEGEVYVDVDTARERHTEFDSSFEDEIVRYVVHGTLHLVGFRDSVPSETQQMKQKENEYVSLYKAGRF